MKTLMVIEMFKNISKVNFIELSKINLLYANSSRVSQHRKKKAYKYEENPSSLYKDILINDNIIQAAFMSVLFWLILVKMPFDIAPGLLDGFVGFFVFITFIQSFTYFYNIFYESKDVSLLKSFPVNQKEVFYSKLAVSSLSVLSSGIPMLLAFYFFFQKNGYGFERILYSLALVLILTMFIIIANIIITQLLMKISSGTRIGKRILNIVSIVSQLSGIVIFMLINSTEQNDDVFVVFKEGVLSGPLLNNRTFLFLVLGSVVLILLSFIIVDKVVASNYYKNNLDFENKKFNRIKKSKESLKGEQRDSSNKADKNKSLTAMSFRYYWRLISSKSTVISSTLISPLVIPLIIAYNAISDSGLNFSGQGIIYKLVVGTLIGFAGGVFINSNPANLSGIMFSIDGNNFDYIKSTPYDFKEYVKDKVIFSSVMFSIIPVLILIGLGIYSNLGILGTLVSMLTFVVVTVGASVLWLQFDLKHLSKDWQNVTELYNRVSKGWLFISTIGVITGLFAFSGIIMLIMNLLSPILALAILLLILLALLALVYYSAKKRFSKIY